MWRCDMLTNYLYTFHSIGREDTFVRSADAEQRLYNFINSVRGTVGRDPRRPDFLSSGAFRIYIEDQMRILMHNSEKCRVAIQAI